MSIVLLPDDILKQILELCICSYKPYILFICKKWYLLIKEMLSFKKYSALYIAAKTIVALSMRDVARFKSFTEIFTQGKSSGNYYLLLDHNFQNTDHLDWIGSTYYTECMRYTRKVDLTGKVHCPLLKFAFQPPFYKEAFFMTESQVLASVFNLLCNMDENGLLQQKEKGLLLKICYPDDNPLEEDRFVMFLRETGIAKVSIDNTMEADHIAKLYLRPRVVTVRLSRLVYYVSNHAQMFESLLESFRKKRVALIEAKRKNFLRYEKLPCILL